MRPWRGAATIAWQAVALMEVATMIGIPLGLVIGRCAAALQPARVLRRE